MIGLAQALPAVESFAQMAAQRVLNSLPEGLLLAACAGLLLRLMRKQNAGTRFAVWLTALVGVATLPVLGGIELGGHALGLTSRAEVTVPGGWAVAFAALWMGIACLALARLVAGLWQVRAIRRGCAEVELGNLDPILREALGAEDSASERRVRLLTSETVRVPAAIGFWKPAIVLPAWCLRELSAEELRPILIHERAHLRRGDDWTNLLQKLVRAILFFHPAVWWIDARLSLEREMACDDAVLAATGNAQAYAGSLIGLLERGCARRGWTMAQAAVARAREASARIARILTGQGAASTRVGRGALGLAAALCLTAFALLEFAPQMVAIAPEMHIAQAEAMANLHGDVVVADGNARGELHGVEVVPAMYHAAAMPHPAAVHRAIARPASQADPLAPAERMASLKRPPAEAPQVQMARMDENAAHQPSAVQDAAWTGQMVMVVETAETQVVPAQAGSTTAQNETTKTGTGGRVLQIRTVQVVEEDETGVHIRTYREVLMIPTAQAGFPAAI